MANAVEAALKARLKQVMQGQWLDKRVEETLDITDNGHRIVTVRVKHWETDETIAIYDLQITERYIKSDRL